MTKTLFIPVINEEPDARKKGLRIVIDGVEVYENGQIKAFSYHESDHHAYGSGLIYVDPEYRLDLNGMEAFEDAKKRKE